MPQQQNLTVPIAIVVAGALVAGALYFSSQGNGGTNTPNNTEPTFEAVVPISADDHILGNPNAEVFVIEYSDLECPFCKQFHTTMQRIIDEYGMTGKVAWVYRNFPLSQLHPNAPRLAEAAECVADLGGNATYWEFLDALFVEAPINTFFDFTRLDATVSSVGVNVSAFNDCYESGKFRTKIEQEFNDAIAVGGQGTPHNIIVTKDGQEIPLPGAQPYETVKAAIEAALQ